MSNKKTLETSLDNSNKDLVNRYHQLKKAIRKAGNNLRVAENVIYLNNSEDVPEVSTETPHRDNTFSLERCVVEFENALKHAKEEIDKVFSVNQSQA